MEKERSFKTMALLALVLSVFGVSVAFAAMSTILNINGTARMTPLQWDIHFANLVENTQGDPQFISHAQITAPTTIGDFDITLTKPGDAVVYTFDVVNGGDIDARLFNVGKTAPTCTGTEPDAATDQALVCNNLTYTLTYTDGGAEVINGATLAAKTSVNMTLTLRFNDITSMPTNSVSIDGLNITLNYVQD